MQYMDNPMNQICVFLFSFVTSLIELPSNQSVLDKCKNVEIFLTWLQSPCPGQNSFIESKVWMDWTGEDY